MTYEAYANYAMGPPQVSFSFRVEPPTDSLCWCLLQCFFSAFRFPCGCHVHQCRVQPLGFALLQPYGVYLLQAYVLPGDGLWPTPGVPEWLLH